MEMGIQSGWSPIPYGVTLDLVCLTVRRSHTLQVVGQDRHLEDQREIVAQVFVHHPGTV